MYSDRAYSICLATVIMIFYKKKGSKSRNADAYYKSRGKTSARDQFPGNKGLLNNIICIRCPQYIPIVYRPVARVARFGFMDVHYERADN